MGDLAVDTAVEPVGDAAGRFRATLSSDWNIWGPNGGYLAAVALRAVGAATALPRPASFTCHYLGVAAFEPVELEVVPLRTSRRAESLRVSMTQGGRPVLEGMAWVVANGMDGMRHDATVAPDVPGPEALPPMEELLPADAPRHAFFDNLEQRPVGPVNWDDRTAGDPDYQAWFRFRPREHFDDPFAEAGRLAVLVDTFLWPAATRAYDADGLAHIAPSLDLAVSFHALGATSPWALVDARSPLAADGLVGGAATVWDPDGRLLASGGQQMLCRPAPPMG